MARVKFKHDNGKYYYREQDERRSRPEDDGSYRSLNRLLLLILIAMLITFVGGTAIALAKNGGELSVKYRKSDPTPKQVVNSSLKTKQSVSAYTELGQIRTVTKGTGNDAGTLLVVSPWFSYPSSDIQLYEELAQKEKQEKSIIIGYFSSYTKEELMAMGEQRVKEGIREKINEQMVMGQISSVYFDDYMFFE
ncbi:MAG: flagellar basal body-associated FliL family protein [Treponema sp.]|nr:flagellar basal body-associated FliL family protein [Treponema sp.]MCR5620891.1 flagellar basal body-associated FliL family protein [Treponema sp.]